MPHRLVCLGILLFWAVAASALLVRDVLPDLLTGPPPDLRSIAHAEAPPGPTIWTILVQDEPTGDIADGLRAVGKVKTESIRQIDGFVRFVSEVDFDSGSLLRGSPLEAAGVDGERVVILSFIDVDESGNLRQLRSGVRLAGAAPSLRTPNGSAQELISIEGHLVNNSLEIRAAGPALLFPWKKSFPYQARGVVQNSLGPMERIPGLHVGQRWESRVVSPLSGRVEVVHSEVTDRNVLVHWNDELVPCYELVTRSKGLSARTWARGQDGLVIRQEVPLYFAKLVLERNVDDRSTQVSADRPMAPAEPRASDDQGGGRSAP